MSEWEEIEVRRGESCVVVSRTGSTLLNRYGRVGGPLDLSKTHAESLDAARRAFERRVYRLLKKKYALANHAGENESLLELIAEDPDRSEAYEVYADWLDDLGDPRGEVIRAGIALAKTNDAIAESRFDALLHRHRFRMCAREWKGAPPDVELRWRFGFVHALATQFPDRHELHFRRGWTKLSRHAAKDWALFTIDDFLRDVMAHPSGRFVRRLIIQRARGADRHFAIRIRGEAIEIRGS